MLADRLDVVIGVDTHRDEHTLAVVDARTGGVRQELSLEAGPAGYLKAQAIGTQLGSCRRVWALEGTGAYGAGLRRHLLAAGETVAEIDRPERRGQRSAAKSDALDAVRAARTLLGRARIGAPRADGPREALRVLLLARHSAVETGARAIRQIRALVLSAPDAIREPLRGLSQTALIRRCAALAAAGSADPVMAATGAALGSLARLALSARQEARAHERALAEQIQARWPELLAEPGVGPITAAQILISWSHRGRIRSEAAFARLAGVAPIPASSGRLIRHRLDRGGERQLNRALHTIMLARRNRDPATRAYIERRSAEGKSTREATRSLKRYLARHIFRLLERLPDRA